MCSAPSVCDFGSHSAGRRRHLLWVGPCRGHSSDDPGCAMHGLHRRDPAPRSLRLPNRTWKNLGPSGLQPAGDTRQWPWRMEVLAQGGCRGAKGQHHGDRARTAGMAIARCDHLGRSSNRERTPVQRLWTQHVSRCMECLCRRLLPPSLSRCVPLTFSSRGRENTLWFGLGKHCSVTPHQSD